MFYMLRKGAKTGTIAWVLQLVVNSYERGHSIGVNMMRSIFQLSSCYAWGLYTANVQTIKILEDATFRKINIQTI